MNSPAHELAQHLASQGIGTLGGTSGWAINVSREPGKPDNCITLYDTGGNDPVNVDISLRAPTVQVRLRSHDYPSIYVKHQDIFDLLAVPLERTIGEHHYIGIWQQGDIADLGQDDDDRHLITVNYRINRQLNGAT